MAWAHLEEEPPSVSGRRPELPERIDPVLRRAMAKQPGDRYPTCAALIAAAEDALGLGRPPAVRRRALVIGAAVACVLLAAALAATWVARGTGHHTPAPPAVRANTLVRIDPATNKVDAVIGVGRSPFEAAVAGPRVWVYNYAGPSVTEIDAATRAVVQTTAVATSPTNSLTSSTGPDLAADQGGAWLIGVDQRGTPYLTRVLAGGGKREYRLKQRPLAVAAGYGFVWVAARGAHHSWLLRIDPATGQITKQTRFPAAAPIDGITTGLGNVWVDASSNATLYRVNPHSARRTAGVHLGGRSSRPAVVLGPIWIVLSYGASSATDIIDPRTVRTVDTVSGEDTACCATGENGSIWSYDPPTGTVERWTEEPTKASSISPDASAVFRRPLPDIDRSRSRCCLGDGHAERQLRLLTRHCLSPTSALPQPRDPLVSKSSEGGEMQGKVQLRVMLVVMGTLAATATVWLSVASATNHKPPLAVSPATVLTWNTYTVTAVRASSPTKFQTDGWRYARGRWAGRCRDGTFSFSMRMNAPCQRASAARSVCAPAPTRTIHSDTGTTSRRARRRSAASGSTARTRLAG